MRGGLRSKDKKWFCMECYKKAGKQSKPFLMLSEEEIRELIEDETGRITEISDFNVTKKIGNHIFIDEPNRKWLIPNILTGSIKKSRTYNIDDIVCVELLEDDGQVSSGGVGRAVVGGVLFGGIGAVVGAGTAKSKPVCNSLKVKITMNDIDNPIVYINFIDSPVKKKGTYTALIYDNALKAAHECLAVLQLLGEKQGK